MRVGTSALVIFLCLLWDPMAAFGQAIAGTVKDPSGASLPGVTVEARSPALIEKVRIAVTDDIGQYRIEALRPGVYTITFTRIGFQSSQREGIDLSGAVTATVNAQLALGQFTETFTVPGEAPLVDVHTAAHDVTLRGDLRLLLDGDTSMMKPVSTSASSTTLFGRPPENSPCQTLWRGIGPTSFRGR